MVRHTLVVKPDVSNRELLARAKEIAPDAVAGLSLRQFHGKFRLPVVRFEMGPRKEKRNGAPSKAATAESKAGTKTETQATPPAAKSAATSAGRKRGRRKTAAAASGMDSAVRQVLIEFAVELEKAQSRSELLGVIAGVDGFVQRIVSFADDAYGRRSSPPAA